MYWSRKSVMCTQCKSRQTVYSKRTPTSSIQYMHTETNSEIHTSDFTVHFNLRAIVTPGAVLGVRGVCWTIESRWAWKLSHGQRTVKTGKARPLILRTSRTKHSCKNNVQTVRHGKSIFAPALSLKNQAALKWDKQRKL